MATVSSVLVQSIGYVWDQFHPPTTRTGRSPRGLERPTGSYCRGYVTFEHTKLIKCCDTHVSIDVVFFQVYFVRPQYRLRDCCQVWPAPARLRARDALAMTPACLGSKNAVYRPRGEVNKSNVKQSYVNIKVETNFRIKTATPKDRCGYQKSAFVGASALY